MPEKNEIWHFRTGSRHKKKHSKIIIFHLWRSLLYVHSLLCVHHWQKHSCSYRRAGCITHPAKVSWLTLNETVAVWLMNLSSWNETRGTSQKISSKQGTKKSWSIVTYLSEITVTVIPHSSSEKLSPFAANYDKAHHTVDFHFAVSSGAIF